MEKWPLWEDSIHVYCAKFMLTVSPNGNPSLYSNYIEIKYIKKNLNNVLIKMLA